MGRGNYGATSSKSRTSLGWLFLLLVPVAIVIIHFDVLSFDTKPAEKFPSSIETLKDVVKPVSASQEKSLDSGNARVNVPNPMPGVGNVGQSVQQPKIDPPNTQRKLLVGSDTATQTHTCEGGKHAVDDDGNSCIPDLQYKLFRSVIFAVDKPDVRYIVCAIPKNGCTYHLAIINRIYGETDFESTGVVHDIDRKNVYKLSARGTQLAAKMLVDPSLPKYIVVRNPLHRTMSAYLNKVENFLPPDQRTVENFAKWVYKEFPKNLPIDRSWDGMNPHWMPQMQFCGFRLRDVHSYFKIFRVEEPAAYVEFIYKFVPEKYLKDGWAKEENLSFREHVLGPRLRTEGTSEKFLKYFNSVELFDHLARVLSLDIESFGYVEDVKRLRESVKKRIELLSQHDVEDMD